jgi:CRISPR-associated endonuclease/helicase Cas3
MGSEEGQSGGGRAARFFAHSIASADRSHWQPLAEHLLNVAQLAAERAARFKAAEWGRAAGLLHDLGKYSLAFQRRLSGESAKVDHATAGAVEAGRRGGKNAAPIQFVVAGHHAGLADGYGESAARRATLEERLRQRVEDYAAFRAEIELPDALSSPPFAWSRSRCGFQLALFTRMLMGALVDADYRDTEAFYDRIEGRPIMVPQAIDMEALALLLDRHLSGIEAAAPPSPVDALRAEVLAACRDKAGLPQGLFTLTVPTGGGKTLASLAFALRHAIRHGLDRIVYVVPFTSIIEQNAQELRRALGEDAVLEHHTGFDDDTLEPDSRRKLRHVTASWEAPVVMTTAVQIFESLFSDRPGRCRKLPSLAKAVIVLDEAQTMPLQLLQPCVAVLDELARNYGSSIILCTATQPALGKDQGFVGGLENVHEIAPSPSWLYEKLRRVTVVDAGTLDMTALAEALRRHDQVLCIVDTRNQARDLSAMLGSDAAHLHLSLNMCAKHRSAKLETIRQRLKDGLPCRVIATSLIEAGVDVDFPCVFRAETGLDQLAQAAGRCNRNGSRPPEGSLVHVFKLEGSSLRGGWQRRVSATNAVRRRHTDLLGLDAIKDFFGELYWSEGDGLDHERIMPLCEERARDGLIRFAEIASLFKMIEEEQRTVIVPFDEDGRRLLRGLAAAERPPREIMRKLQRHVVTLRDRPFASLVVAGAVQKVGQHDGLFQLVNERLYRDDMGLTFDDPTFRAAEDSIF